MLRSSVLLAGLRRFGSLRAANQRFAGVVTQAVKNRFQNSTAFSVSARNYSTTGDGSSDALDSFTVNVPPDSQKAPKYRQVVVVPIPDRPLFPGTLYPVVLTDETLISALKGLKAKGIPYCGVFLKTDIDVEEEGGKVDKTVKDAQIAAAETGDDANVAAIVQAAVQEAEEEKAKAHADVENTANPQKKTKQDIKANEAESKESGESKDAEYVEKEEKQPEGQEERGGVLASGEKTVVEENKEKPGVVDVVPTRVSKLSQIHKTGIFAQIHRIHQYPASRGGGTLVVLFAHRRIEVAL